MTFQHFAVSSFNMTLPVSTDDVVEQSHYLCFILLNNLAYIYLVVTEFRVVTCMEFHASVLAYDVTIASVGMREFLLRSNCKFTACLLESVDIRNQNTVSFRASLY